MSKKHSGIKEGEFYLTVYDTSADYRGIINGQTVTFSLWGCSNNTILRDNLPFLSNVVDNCEYLNTKAKEAIIEYFELKDADVTNYFYDIFEFMKYVGKRDHIKTFGVADFAEVDIKSVVAKMNCYYVSINYEDNMDIDLSYIVSDGEYYNDKRLVVVMDKRFAVKKFFSVFD